MDIYLLQMIGNWLSVLFISFISCIGVNLHSNVVSVRENEAAVKSVTVLSEVVPYSTDYVYKTDVIKKGGAALIKEGSNGLNYVYADGTVKNFVAPVNEVREVYNGTDSVYTGRLTGYGPDCDSCDGRGLTYCKTKAGKYFSLINDGEYYDDDEFGKVRIVAAPINEFPCGTIIYVDNGRLEPFYAVVLDTGFSMKSGYSSGIIWLDLAFKTENDKRIYSATSYNTKYIVKRWGW